MPKWEGFIDINMALTLTGKLAVRGVPYGWGDKAPSLDCDSAAIHSLDCSGFIRWLLARSSNQGIILPDGSANMREWLQQNHRDWLVGNGRDAYESAGYQSEATEMDFYLCFIDPNSDHAGHVWGVQDGHTLECYGGHGVGRRPFSQAVLMREVSFVFKVPAKI